MKDKMIDMITRYPLDTILECKAEPDKVKVIGYSTWGNVG